MAVGGHQVGPVSEDEIRQNLSNGTIEPYEFTDIDRTLAAGLVLQGKRWGRPNDTIGLGGVINGITGVHETFLNFGGLGILVGDGQLPNPGTERIIETYYSMALSPSSKLTFDYQFIDNPAYNQDRGPVSVIGTRQVMPKDRLRTEPADGALPTATAQIIATTPHTIIPTRNLVMVTGVRRSFKCVSYFVLSNTSEFGWRSSTRSRALSCCQVRSVGSPVLAGFALTEIARRSAASRVRTIQSPASRRSSTPVIVAGCSPASRARAPGLIGP